MTDVKLRPADLSASPLFLRDEELREGMELIYFGYRDFTSEADSLLEEIGLGRAHHRVLHFVGRNPAITINELLSILAITKQSLGRVLKDLMAEDLVSQTQGETDRRFKHLRLTPKGEGFESRLSAALKKAMGGAYRKAGAEAVQGFRQVMLGLMKEDTRAQFKERAEKRR